MTKKRATHNQASSPTPGIRNPPFKREGVNIKSSLRFETWPPI